MIRIIWVGRTRNGWENDAVNDYFGRLKRLEKIEVIEVKEEKSKSPQESMKREGEKILKHLGGLCLPVALDSRGEELTSEGLAQFLKSHESECVTFIIGGFEGLSEDVLSACKKRISLSRMTFTHQAIRFMLAEQIYRAVSINKGLPYHK